MKHQEVFRMEESCQVCYKSFGVTVKLPKRFYSHSKAALFAYLSPLPTVNLPHLEGGAFCMAGVGRSVACNSDVFCLAVALFIINTVYCLTVNLKAGFWCFKQVVECSVFFLIKASAAGLTGVFCLASVYNNRLFAAAVLRIVKAVRYVTV